MGTTCARGSVCRSSLDVLSDMLRVFPFCLGYSHYSLYSDGYSGKGLAQPCSPCSGRARRRGAKSEDYEPSSQLAAHSSQLTAHSSQLTAHSSAPPRSRSRVSLDLPLLGAGDEDDVTKRRPAARAFVRAQKGWKGWPRAETWRKPPAMQNPARAVRTPCGEGRRGQKRAP